MVEYRVLVQPKKQSKSELSIQPFLTPAILVEALDKKSFKMPLVPVKAIEERMVPKVVTKASESGDTYSETIFTPGKTTVVKYREATKEEISVLVTDLETGEYTKTNGVDLEWLA